MEQQTTPVPSPLTCDLFTPHIGEVFMIREWNGEVVDPPIGVELIRASMHQMKPYDGRVTGNVGFVRVDPFALLFEGARETPLPQGVYALEHATLGDLVMLMVPVGPGERGWLYESVYN